MINNFKLIREHLTFTKPNDYYFIEIVKRRKDNPKMTIDFKFIRDYYVYSIEEFDSVKDDILCTCEVAHARALIKLNVRNSETTALTCLKRLVSDIVDKNYKNSTNLFRKVSRDTHAEPEIKLLIDTNNHNDLVFVKSVISEIWEKTNTPGKIIAEVPTPNGAHVIATDFDIDRFKLCCPTINVYRDGSTVIYSPILEKP